MSKLIFYDNILYRPQINYNNMKKKKCHIIEKEKKKKKKTFNNILLLIYIKKINIVRFM